MAYASITFEGSPQHEMVVRSSLNLYTLNRAIFCFIDRSTHTSVHMHSRSEWATSRMKKIVVLQATYLYTLSLTSVVDINTWHRKGGGVVQRLVVS